MKKQATTRERRKCLEWYLSHNRNVAETCGRFDISRRTLYRWLHCYDPDRPQALKPLSRRPRAKRRPLWSVYHLARVSDLNAEHLDWGRRRLQGELKARGWEVSEATVGRMLAIIRRKCPVCGKRDHHEWVRHLVQKDMNTSGIDIGPLYPPKRRKSEAQQALEEVEVLLRGE